ncbi:MAG: hypothetical protein IJC83_00850, partial [Oscillospiraceae bacterium]|nr:hypothetical protein [Oscillospiraceae bacterium]
KTASTICACDEFFDDITLEDLTQSGMKEELVGRLSQIVNLKKMSKSNMVKLIRKKAEIVSKELEVLIELTPTAEKELLEISFGTLGVRYPMNKLREVVQRKLADVYFSSNFDKNNDVIVVKSLKRATIKYAQNAIDDEYTA